MVGCLNLASVCNDVRKRVSLQLPYILALYPHRIVMPHLRQHHTGLRFADLSQPKDQGDHHGK